MAPPTVYTEQTLAEYLHGVLGDMAAALGWSVAGGSYTEIVNETLLTLGSTVIDDFVEPTEIQILRAVARRELWVAVIGSLASKFDFQEDLQAFKRSQMQAMAKEALSRAESDCLQLGVGLGAGLTVELTTLDFQDPYSHHHHHHFDELVLD